MLILQYLIKKQQGESTSATEVTVATETQHQRLTILKFNKSKITLKVS